MSSPASIKLYDLASRHAQPKSWSYNVWKTRLALNYKALRFTTVWVDHNTLKPTLSSLGVAPNTSGQGFEYTVPTMQFPDGEVVTDSAAIVVKLEELYPTPPLGLDADLQAEASEAVHMTIMPLLAEYMPRVAKGVIKEDTIPTFIASREKRVGMSLEELMSTRGGEQAWKAAEPGFAAVKKLLTERKRDRGAFVLGSGVCYADFVLVALFEAFRRVGEDMFQRAVRWDAAFGELYEASKGWMENDQ